LKRNSAIDLQRVYERERKRLTSLVGSDPVSFLHRFSEERDIEMAGFLASQFAYGRVQQVMQFLSRLFGEMAEGPYAFVREGDLSRLAGQYYRFHKGPDIIRLFKTLRRAAQRFDTIGSMIEHYYEGDLRRALWTAGGELVKGDEGLTFFFPRPSKMSPLKRWSLYARWMVRRDEIDFGLWDFIDKGSLIVPLDANIFKIGTCLGWTDQKGQTWKAAQQITEALKGFCAEDPLKYDFFLCHVVGIGGGCTGKKAAACRKGCLLR
jgi:uncharacterized protein (TIGR02757 family)